MKITKTHSKASVLSLSTIQCKLLDLAAILGAVNIFIANLRNKVGNKWCWRNIPCASLFPDSETYLTVEVLKQVK